MRIIYGLNNLKTQRRQSAATIGVFDGVHVGHHKILKELIRKAKAESRQSVVLTFHPHPKKILAGLSQKSTITSLAHRLKLLEGAGVDLCVIIRFTPAFAKKPIDWFIEHILVNKLKADDLIIGKKFLIGKERLSPENLRRIACRYGLRLKVVPAARYKGVPISSSLIRSLIENGKLNLASKLLGRKLTIYGTVIPGERRGRDIGFKTANIDPHHEAIPPSGVYAARVKIGRKSYKGLLNIGFRPTFKPRQKEPTVEVHILNFRGNLYNKHIELYFVRKIRPERHFKSKEALREQIKRDISSLG